MQKSIAWVINLPRVAKNAIGISNDLVMLPLAMWLAYCLRLDTLYAPDARVATVIGVSTFVTLFTFVRLGLYRAVIRFLGYQVLTAVVIGVAISSLAMIIAGYLLQAFVPRSVPLIFLGLGLLFVGGTRFALRALFAVDSNRGRQHVVIYGAGESGLQLATTLLQGRVFRPVAFLDDDKSKHGTILNGLRVHKPRHLVRIAADYNVGRVLLAMPQLSPSERARIIQNLSRSEIKVQTVSGFEDIVAGNARIEDLRDVQVNDLLGRDTVDPDPELLRRGVRAKVVMVTGAGGSIGSELCRQIADLEPLLIVLYELSEVALYNIERELQGRNTAPSVSILGNVQDQPLLERTMQTFGVQTVFHAAAYKHVPIVEHNVQMGFRNNVMGTRSASLAAIASGVERFTLISTDKAVRPTNFMGATKRLAELILQEHAVQGAATCFNMVRFGNVLDSSGSVVPLFKSQIENGGPVTVTHAEVTRYFMTIPEAVQLVLQAGAMSESCDVFLLDMGKPVAIRELARTMINLMGRSIRTDENPEGDIEIRYTGLRPGEKLYEELLISDNSVGTDHPMIMRGIEDHVDSAMLARAMEDFQVADQANDVVAMMRIMAKTVAGYRPETQVHDHLASHTRNQVSSVTPLPLLRGGKD